MAYVNNFNQEFPNENYLIYGVICGVQNYTSQAVMQLYVYNGL